MVLVEATCIYGQSDREHASIASKFGSLMWDLVMMAMMDLAMMKQDSSFTIRR